MTVRFAGDGRYAPRSAAALVYAKAKINTGLYNYCKTGKIGSQTAAGAWKYYTFTR